VLVKDALNFENSCWYFTFDKTHIFELGRKMSGKVLRKTVLLLVFVMQVEFELLHITALNC